MLIQEVNQMRAVFMGTPDFSVPVLEAMIEHGMDVVGVVTQPDRPKGRGKGVVCSPVKEAAMAHGLHILQPEKVRTRESVAELAALAPDVMVVVAFGQILTKEVLDIPKYGCINVHASLLPSYRGAAPIQYAVLDGLKETGVTTMFMDEGLDTGDILLVKKLPIAPDETGGSLFDKLSTLGAQALIETIDALEAGTLQRIPQTGESNYVGMIKKSMGHIDWSKDAVTLDHLIRGMNPWPSAFTYRNGKLLKIWKALVVDRTDESTPGTVVEVTKKDFTVQTGKGALLIAELQPEGKKRMSAAEYLRGYPVSVGEVLDAKEE